MTVLTSKIFWIRSLERAIKTFAQSIVTLLGADQVGFFDVNYKEVILSALFATVLSFLTSLASSLKGDSESPSLVENKVEEQIVEKIEAGEPVGDPERVIEPEDIVYEDIELEVEADAEEAPKPKAVRKRRATAKKRIT